MQVTKEDVARYIKRGTDAVEASYPHAEDTDNCVDTILAILYLCRSRKVDPFTVIDTVTRTLRRELNG